MNKSTKLVNIFEFLMGSILIIDWLANLSVIFTGMRDLNFDMTESLHHYGVALICTIAILFIIIFLFKKGYYSPQKIFLTTKLFVKIPVF